MSYNQQDDNLATESGRKIMFPINMAFFWGNRTPLCNWAKPWGSSLLKTFLIFLNIGCWSGKKCHIRRKWQPYVTWMTVKTFQTEFKHIKNPSIFRIHARLIVGDNRSIWWLLAAPGFNSHFQGDVTEASPPMMCPLKLLKWKMSNICRYLWIAIETAFYPYSSIIFPSFFRIFPVGKHHGNLPTGPSNPENPKRVLPGEATSQIRGVQIEIGEGHLLLKQMGLPGLGKPIF